MAVEAIAPPRMQFNPEQTDGLAVAQLRRIISSRQRGEMQMLSIGRMRKPRRALEHAGPRTTLGIDRAVQHEGKLLIELTVLVRHPGANHLTPESLHAFGNADMGL